MQRTLIFSIAVSLVLISRVVTMPLCFCSWLWSCLQVKIRVTLGPTEGADPNPWTKSDDDNDDDNKICKSVGIKMSPAICLNYLHALQQSDKKEL